MAQNIYDNPEFFAGYAQLPRSMHGLDGAPEWAALRSLLPPDHTVVGWYADPQTAFAQATACAEPADRILVFGSFFTVGGVLAQGVPRMQGRHATHPSP